MKNAFSHSKHCFHCGKQRPRKNLGYDLESLKTYCNDNPECHQENPFGLMPLDAQTVRTTLYSQYDKEFVDALDRMLGKPLSTRLQPYLAMHLLKTAEVNELTSLNEALLFVLNKDFEQNEITDYVIPEWTEQPEEEETSEPEEAEACNEEPREPDTREWEPFSNFVDELEPTEPTEPTEKPEEPETPVIEEPEEEEEEEEEEELVI